jgi:hypothetical protein
LFSIAAQFILNAVGFTKGADKVVRANKKILKEMDEMHLTADQAGISLSQLNRSLQIKNATTQAQRDIKLTNQSIRTLISGVKEARHWYKAFRQERDRAMSGPIGRFFGMAPTKKARGGGGGGKAAAAMAPMAMAAMAGGMGGGGGRAGSHYSLLGSVFGPKQFGGMSFTGVGGMFGGGGGILGTMVDAFVQAGAESEFMKNSFASILGNIGTSTELMEKLTKYSAETPFAKTDILQASRVLLNLTGKNVEKNEKLVKLSGNLAAFSPGTDVTQASMALADAAMGEFGRLKESFGLAFRADDFNKLGRPGGEAYIDGVMKAIEEGLSRKTGGRDLVKALSETFLGRMSTIKDNFGQISEMVGEELIGGLDLKGMAAGAGDFMGALVKDVKAAFMGQTSFLRTDNQTIRFISDWIVYLVEAAKTAKTTLVSMFTTAMGWFERISPTMKATVMGVAGSLLGAFGVGGPIAAIAGTVGGIMGALGMLLAPFSEIILPALGFAIVGIGFVLLPLVAAFAAVIGTIAAMRRDGESLIDTTIRLALAVKDFALLWFNRLWASAKGFITGVWPRLSKAWNELSGAFSKAMGPIREFLGTLFGGESIGSMERFAEIGELIGKVLGFVASVVLKGFTLALKAFGFVLNAFAPGIKHTVSDIKQLGKAIIDFISGADMSKTTMKTVFLGFVDIVTAPFREILVQLSQIAGKALGELAIKVAPFSTRLSEMLSDAAFMFLESESALREGFLATKDVLSSEGPTLKVDWGDAPDVKVDVGVNIDGEKLADSQAKTKLRARNSGRGGDPASPDELGFILEGGGTRIRTVGLNEVLGS